MLIAEIPISLDTVKAARDRADRIGKLDKSITSGSGNLVGVLGELIFLTAYPHAKWVDGIDHDFEIGGHTIDVKTLTTSVTPKATFCGHVPTVTKMQNVQQYVFARVHSGLHIGWLIGRFPSNEIHKRGVYLVKGAQDPHCNFEWKARCNCWDIPYSNLTELKNHTQRVITI